MIEVLDSGALTSVQDVIGRPAWRHLGMPAGGAADAWSARLANRLVGNPDEAPLLEMTSIGPTLRIEATATVALVGRFEASVDGLPFPADAGRTVRAGSVVRIGAGEDGRGYLAFGGGLAVEAVLGSAATDLRTGFGGFEGRALRAGDRLTLGVSAAGRPMRWVGARVGGPIRLVAGLHPDSVPPDALTGSDWQVSALADRTGVRLDGPGITTSLAEVPSMGLPVGAVQVPPDGRPIVMLADRPVTGGYPVPAVVIGADVGRVARLRTGDHVTFTPVSLDAARSALRRAEAELAALETLEGPGNDELGWAGSHR